MGSERQIEKERHRQSENARDVIGERNVERERERHKRDEKVNQR